MVYSTDDFSVENMRHFHYWDTVKRRNKSLRLLVFVVAKDMLSIQNRCRFERWYLMRKDWVTLGVHCYDHEKTQEGWREDQKYYIKQARDILNPYLPGRYLYRPPGFRFLPKTEKILKELGFAGIAHQDFIKYFDTGEKIPVFNTHCTHNKYYNAIGQIWEKIHVE